ncbi:hypothetical protein AYL99_08045 [Fonsecaea erecta]|uniref:Uncharacterized protein n=1 Tax=Fonsecaea erecta TaxID=1367422 RepID=A0A178ZC03_9EURO|nr:hypothetical protein AYL99_08045 [Fonsecaea erecta]OAP57307.1 hypothetical protein AYL99_08045 [Fonsecaea erecta]
MAPLTLHEACLWLADAMEQYWSSDEVLNRQHSALISGLRSSSAKASEGKQTVLALMPALICHVDEVVQRGQPDGFKNAILNTLADSTRDVPLWRPLFGLEAKQRSVINDNEMRGRSPPDCIVEVVRRVISGTAQATTSEQLRSALRIIANCCADNNINRSIIVERSGIETMLEMVRERRECDLVIPTLYNVCVDYDEPARNAAGEPWVSLQAKGEEAESDTTINAAEQRLGTYWSNEKLTSFEILLRAKDSGKVSIGTLTDLIEMASRIALHGTHNFVHKANGNATGDLVDIDTTADILHSLLTHGVELANEDIDCRASMCQAVLNLLSQADTHRAVSEDFRMIWNLVHLPYPSDDSGDEIDDPDEEEQVLLPYRKAMLKMVYSISATETYEHVSGSQSPLIRNCITFLDVDKPLGLSASICVLLANSIVSKERAEQLIKSTPNIARFLSELFVKTTESEVLLPALSLAMRLSLCPEGQDAFHEVNMASAVSRLLGSTKSEVDSLGLQIQRDVIALVRLMIKGRIEYLPQLACNRKDSSDANLMAMVFSIFEKTSHPETKAEVGRLSIEVVRTLFPSRQHPMQSATASGKDRPGHIDHEKAESLFQYIFPAQATTPALSTPETPTSASTTVADTIGWILTQSTSLSSDSQPQQQSPSPHPSLSQAEAEAWFGLALLSTFPSTHGSIRAAMARDDFQLLKRLREIATQTRSSLDGSRSLEGNKEDDQGESARGGNAAPGLTGKTATNKSVDPRYENIKVLIARMVQPQSASHHPHLLPLQSSTLDKKAQSPRTTPEDIEADKQVQAGLEAAAAEMGLDWVLL